MLTLYMVAKLKSCIFYFDRRAIKTSLAVFFLTTFTMTSVTLAMVGDLYEWMDDKGRVHYSSESPVINPESAKVVEPTSSPQHSTMPSKPSVDGAADRSTKISNRSDTPKPAATLPVTDSSHQAGLTSPPALKPLAPPLSNISPVAKSEQPAQPDIVEVVAQGMGIDANSALLNAYSNAVQQALGLYIDAETLMQNDAIVHDKILTYSKGFIQEATKINESQANGLFQVKVHAKVKQQQLFEQVKVNNISTKPLDGLNLHAQVESQLKQDKDAKELLEKVLLPLVKTTLHRAELVPSTIEQPNPTINKKETDNNFVTLDFKIYLWIDEKEYLKYVKNNLIPVLDQIANHELGYNINFLKIDKDEYIKYNISRDKVNVDSILIYVLYWEFEDINKNNGIIYKVLKDYVPLKFLYKKNYVNIKLSLLDDNKELISSNEKPIICDNVSCSSGYSRYGHKPASLYLGDDFIIISPFFTENAFNNGISLMQKIEQLKSKYITIGVKIARENLPRVKITKLDISSSGE